MLYTLDNLPLEITYDGNDIKSTGISGTLNPHESLLIEDIQIEWPIDILDYKYSGEIDLITVKLILFFFYLALLESCKLNHCYFFLS